MEQIYDEVDFEQYCKTCKYADRDERYIPCCYCLEDPILPNTKKPACWEEKEC